VALDIKWMHAQLNLAWRVVVHYTKKLIPGMPRFGIQRFQENYVAEGLPPATLSFRAVAHEPGRCTGCGVCDSVCPILQRQVATVSADDFLGPMRFIQAGARSAPHLVDVRRELDVLTSDVCVNCRQCDRHCPERIPIADVAAALAAQLHTINRAKQGTMPIDEKALPALPPKPKRALLPKSSPPPSR
jgi:formate hydrogenlyase subunit 6/NADH:ubiquinone oxidoreductase subunit I